MRLKLLPALALLTGIAACDRPSEVEPPVPPDLEGPVEWSVVVTADKREIQVGEDLSVQVTIRHPPEE